jgi:hypothetical protein
LISTLLYIFFGWGEGVHFSSTKFYVDISILALHLISTLLLCFLGGGGSIFPPIRLTLMSVYKYIFTYFPGRQQLLEYDKLSTLLSSIFQQYRGSRFYRWRKPVYPENTTTYSKWLNKFITSSCIDYTSPWTGFKRKTLVVIGTDCIGIIAIILRFFSLDLGTDLTARFVFYLISICTVYH